MRLLSLQTKRHAKLFTNSSAWELMARCSTRCVDSTHMLDHPPPPPHIHTQVVKSPVTGSFKQRRSKVWRDLSAGELLVWMGITLRMGTLGRARAGHYWCNVDGLHDDTIGASMSKNRYNAITANLSFAPRGSPTGWAKISWLDTVLRKACRAATGLTQHVAIDESMIKVLSRFCPWLQYMPKKPIKRGKYVAITLHAFCILHSAFYIH